MMNYEIVRMQTGMPCLIFTSTGKLTGCSGTVANWHEKFEENSSHYYYYFYYQTNSQFHETR